MKSNLDWLPAPHSAVISYVRRSSLGLPPAPLWAAISYVALSTCASIAASEPLCFLWDGRKGKSTGSDHPLTCKRYYIPVCVLRRSKSGLPPAPHWATISCVALSTSSSTAASEQLCFIWDSRKGKSTGSDHPPM
jgi:hypothetical protein